MEDINIKKRINDYTDKFFLEPNQIKILNNKSTLQSKERNKVT